MNIENFKAALSGVRTAENKRASYHGISVKGNAVVFTRDSTGNQESVFISELYALYCKEEYIDTNIARKYITGRVYSPSVAILKAADLVDFNGDRLRFDAKEVPHLNIKNGDHIIHPPTSYKKSLKPVDTGTNDEALFFAALRSIVGSKHLYAKSVGFPVGGDDVYLSDNFTKYDFKSDKIELDFLLILEALNGTEKFDSKSLARHVDGLIYDHPVLGRRIVEFDEEQHFTPARKETLQILSENCKIPYAKQYIDICNDLEYLNNQVLKKHRIKEKLVEMPYNFIAFTEWLIDSKVRLSGYIASKTAFDYKGGRIAQRAYYDSLRDVAHLSAYNKKPKLNPPLRFAKYTFEEKYNTGFSNLTKDEIKDGIKVILKGVYNL